VRKEKEGDQDQPYLSLYRYRLRGCQPPQMYEYRLCLYACDLDVALFHSWLQGITSKSVKKSENSLLNPGGCFPRHGTRRTRAAVPHYARAEVALLSGGKGVRRQ